jgi:hypothetical protein
MNLSSIDLFGGNARRSNVLTTNIEAARRVAPKIGLLIAGGR